MQAQGWRLLPCHSPFAGLGAAGPPKMDLPECVEDITQWAFHKGISPASLSGFLRHSHRYQQVVHCKKFRRTDGARVTGYPEVPPRHNSPVSSQHRAKMEY